MKPFSLINGLMLGTVFGSAFLATLATDLADRSRNQEDGRRAFGQLVRSERKTFFGFEHYYFTCQLREGPREYRLTEEVRSDLYHLKREGDNVEVTLFPGGQLRLSGNAREDRPLSERPVIWLSVPLALMGALMTLASLRTNPGADRAPRIRRTKSHKQTVT